MKRSLGTGSQIPCRSKQKEILDRQPKCQEDSSEEKQETRPSNAWSRQLKENKTILWVTPQSVVVWWKIDGLLVP